jgi:hypothetical protein
MCYTMLNGMIMADTKLTLCKEAFLAYFNMLSHHSAGWTEKNHVRSQSENTADIGTG